MEDLVMAYNKYFKVTTARFANVAHSCQSGDARNQRMKGIYSHEMPHFLSSIVPQSDDPRRQVPQVVIDEMMQFLLWIFARFNEK